MFMCMKMCVFKNTYKYVRLLVCENVFLHRRRVFSIDMCAVQSVDTIHLAILQTSLHVDVLLLLRNNSPHHLSIYIVYIQLYIYMLKQSSMHPEYFAEFSRGVHSSLFPFLALFYINEVGKVRHILV